MQLHELKVVLFLVGLLFGIFGFIKENKLLACIAFVLWAYFNTLHIMDSELLPMKILSIVGAIATAIAALCNGVTYIYEEKND